MKIEKALQSDIDRSDAEILLGNILKQDRTWIIAHPEYELTEKQLKEWELIVQRRKSHEPVSYITGLRAFFGRDFFVDPSVLIPRPATEELVSITLKVFKGEKVPRITEIDNGIIAFANIWGNVDSVKVIEDIGTGSGCLAVTLACELPDLTIIATDISKEALFVAQKNARKWNVLDRIIFKQGSGLDPLKDFDQPFLIVTNPPYIPDSETLMPDVADFEPHKALFGGIDGRDVIEVILKQAKNHPMCVGVVMECKKLQMS